MKMRPITKEDLKHGVNTVEHFPANEIFNGDSLSPPANEPAPRIFHFGKHKGRSVEWVKENDAEYYQWCVENVRGFKG